MGNEGPPDTQRNVIDEVENAVVAGESTDTGEIVPVKVSNGVLYAFLTSPEGAAITDAMASVAKDQLRVDIVGDSTTDPLDVDLEDIGGQAQSAVDVANKIDQIEDALESEGTDTLRSRIHDSTGTQIDPATQALEAALKANDTDEFVSRITDSTGTEIDPATQALENALEANGADEFRASIYAADDAGNLAEIQAEDIGTALGGTETALITHLARALNSQALDEFVSRLTDSAGTQIDPLNQDALQAVANDELRSRIHDSAGTQIDPERAVDFPNQQVTGEDLTVDNTVIGPFTVAKSEALVVAVNETSGGSLNVTVDWTDGSGNTFQSESATDIGLSGVIEDWARLVRKGPQAIVTLSNSSSATSTNAHVDTEK